MSKIFLLSNNVFLSFTSYFKYRNFIAINYGDKPRAVFM